MQIVYQTRFSFLGRSGWQSPDSTDPKALLSDDRLRLRFLLFEQLTLRGLTAQTDGDFRHLVLSAAAMPAKWKRRLTELCTDTLGSERAIVLFEPPARAARRVKRAVAARFGDAPVLAQTVLDDDDALACDFTALLRAEAAHAGASPTTGGPGYCYLSFATGVTLGWPDAGTGAEPDLLTWRHVPFTNLGLTLVARPDSSQHPFATSHRHIGRRHPSRLIAGPRPYYLRCVHGQNDSRAIAGTDRLNAAQLEATRRAFPSLAALQGLAGPMAAAE